MNDQIPTITPTNSKEIDKQSEIQSIEEDIKEALKKRRDCKETIRKIKEDIATAWELREIWIREIHREGKRGDKDYKAIAKDKVGKYSNYINEKDSRRKSYQHREEELIKAINRLRKQKSGAESTNLERQEE